MSHIVLVGALAETLINFRGDLIRAFVSAGHRVTAMAAPTNVGTIQAIESLGATFRPYPVQRNGLNPFKDFQTLLALRKVFRELQPDVVMSYTVKPVIWSGMALRGMSFVRYYGLVTGLGFAFQGQGLIRRTLTFIVSRLYRVGLSTPKNAIFQNSDDKNLFIARRIVRASKCAVVSGSGVNLTRFDKADLPVSGSVFLLIARLLGEKGIREYIRAAWLVKQRYPDAEFKLLGPTDPSPDGIPQEEIQHWHQERVIDYLGSTADVRPVIADCHISVLPSYHEGIPRTLLEAMSMGRPILTTDVPGCRETVVQGINGYLVPKCDANALAERMIWFIENRTEWLHMGLESRHIAEQRFDVHKVNAEMLRIMELDSGT